MIAPEDSQPVVTDFIDTEEEDVQDQAQKDIHIDYSKHGKNWGELKLCDLTDDLQSPIDIDLPTVQ